MRTPYTSNLDDLDEPHHDPTNDEHEQNDEDQAAQRRGLALALASHHPLRSLDGVSVRLRGLRTRRIEQVQQRVSLDRLGFGIHTEDRSEDFPTSDVG